MKATWEVIEKNQGVLDIEVDSAKVNDALDRAFRKVATKVNVPGFRKGKVPRQIFEAKFGVESLYQDALDILLPEVYTQAVKEAGIDPIDRPEIDIEQFSKNEPLKFKAKVLVKPEVTLGQYKGLEVEAPSSEVSEEEVQEELKRLQDRHAELVVLEEGKAENGDTVVIDFEGFVDGVAFEGGKAEKYSLELGSGSFIPGFEEQVVGLEKDGEKDITVTFPEEYHSEALAGKEAVFKIKLHDIKRKNLPELDDEFAKDVSEFETLEAFKEDIVKRLKERKENDNKTKLQNAVLDKASANATVDVPEVMIETELDAMVQEFGNRLRMQGMNLEMYYQYSGQDAAALREQMRDDASKRVLNNLVLETIAKEEKLSVTEEEVTKYLQQLASSYRRSVEELRQIFEANGNMDTVYNDLLMQKTVDFLVGNSKQVSAA
ncbi:trigger factor [Paenibacillus turpanensis]|uniref:trigger factor n=1 Tax=Paenibacillus turpanensis TaxID=2689078 RepID=UPI00140A06C3|nr:trigger factor [Paenibacillus turpanensis]